MKLLAFTLILLISGTEAFALSTDGLRTKVICEEGKKILIVFNSNGKEFTAIQLMEASEIAGGPPQPMECNK